MGNFILRFCACPILMALLNQISFETKQKSKCKVEFNLIFISIEKKYFGKIQFFLERIRNQSKLYSTRDISPNLTL